MADNLILGETDGKAMAKPRGNPSGRRDNLGRFTGGNQAALKHGAYSAKGLGTAWGRRVINRRLGELKTALEQAVEDSPQRRILIGQVVRTEGLISIIENYFRRYGILDQAGLLRNRLTPYRIMDKVYLGLLNSQRLSLMALGLDRKPESVPTFAEFVKTFDEKKAKAATAVIEVSTVSPSSGNDEPGGVAR